MRALDRLDLGEVPGTASVWCGRPGGPASFSYAPHATHYAASTMKVAVLAALHRAAEAGRLDLDESVEVRNEFRSAAPGCQSYQCHRGYDNDEAVWERLGEAAPLRWLAERMIARSSNLATNLVLARLALADLAEVWQLCGARYSVVARGIEDAAAAEAGITNLVTAADLSALFGSILQGTVASRAACAAMIDTLLAQEGAEDLAAGLPPGTRIAHKNGWITGVRHGAGIVFPDDAPPFVIAVCLTTPWAVNEQDDKACQFVAQVAAAAWADRHSL
jgi:beta-lactamase class A